MYQINGGRQTPQKLAYFVRGNRLYSRRDMTSVRIHGRKKRGLCIVADLSMGLSLAAGCRKYIAAVIRPMLPVGPSLLHRDRS